MAATIVPYGALGTHLANAAIDWAADTFFISLHTSTYAPDVDTDDFFDDVDNELAASGNYVAGGFEIANTARAYDATSNQERLDGDDVVVAALTPSAAFRYGVMRKARGGAASADELCGYVDFGDDVDPGGSEFRVTWNAAGILAIDAG